MLATVTKRHLADEIRAGLPGLTLYNGADEWIKVRLWGNALYFPPDLTNPKTGKAPVVKHPFLLDTKRQGDSELKPVYVTANGRISKKDNYGFIRDKKGQVVGHGPLPGQDVVSAVTWITANYPFIVYLRGDKTDSAEMKRAKENWLKSRITWAQQTTARRRADVQRWLAQNPGTEPPAPTDKQRKAQRFLESYATTSGWKEHRCRHHDDFDTDDFDEYKAHMLNVHGERVEVPGQLPAVTPPEEATAE